MKKYFIALVVTITTILLILTNFSYTPTALALATDNHNSYYREKSIHNPDGTGKYYLNREIAKVMGHQAMMWLERPSREAEERPQQTVAELELQPDDVVADLGAGTGYFSLRIARAVPQGKVYAVDIQPEMLDTLNYLKSEKISRTLRQF